MNDAKKRFCEIILDKIESGEINSKIKLNLAKLETGRKLGIRNMPSNPDILSHSNNPSKKTSILLSIKPLRTLSGVAPVAIMTKPIKCPHGTCLYCPGGPNSSFGSVPQSYTGNEPATMRAINNNYDAYRQTTNRISQYYATGHNPEKVELIIMGGTFPSFEDQYQNEFIAGAFGAINDFSEHFFDSKKFDSKKFNKTFMKDGKCFSENTREIMKTKNNHSLKEEHAKNEKANIRIVTLCIETRPDWSKENEINKMLTLGATRVELGVQSIYNKVLDYVNRGHGVEETIEATRLLKDSGLKVTYHVMPGLPKSTKEMDIGMFKEIFENPDFRPDGLKIYPCMVMPGTGLEKLYNSKKFRPLETEEAAEIISEAGKYFPYYTRVHRIQRDIPTKFSMGGIDKNNLRQIAEKKMEEKGIILKDIRKRETGINKKINTEIEPELIIRKYEASKGQEFFISFEDKKNDLISGFCRLRKPYKPFRKEFTENTACIRELHVFGSALGIGKHGESEQHKGLGMKLIKEAEKIALEELDCKKLLIISGVGAREYYSKKLNYSRDGVYMSKKLSRNNK